MRICIIEGCDRKHRAHGWCGPHYVRWRRHGDPLGGRGQSDSVRFWTHVDMSNECWLWTASCAGDGRYGYFKLSAGNSIAAHRFSYEDTYGPIPDGLELDHVWDRGCRNTKCVRPEHLEAVTHQENMQRFKSRVTHCPQGHEYTPENTHVWKNRRNCKTCHNAQALAHWRRKQKEKSAV